MLVTFLLIIIAFSSILICASYQSSSIYVSREKLLFFCVFIDKIMSGKAFILESEF